MKSGHLLNTQDTSTIITGESAPRLIVCGPRRYNKI